MDIHAQNVLAPQIEKEQQFENIVDKRVNEERQRQLMDELNRKQWREEVTKSFSSKQFIFIIIMKVLIFIEKL